MVHSPARWARFLKTEMVLAPSNAECKQRVRDNDSESWVKSTPLVVQVLKCEVHENAAND